GVGSTIGFLVAPLAFDFVRTAIERFDRIDWDAVNRLIVEMEHEGRELLRRAGVASDEITMTRSSELRYVGQGHEVRTPVPDGELSAGSAASILVSFEGIYRQLYQRIAPGNPIESVNWRVLASGPTPALPPARLGAAVTQTPAEPIKSYRQVYHPEAGGFVRTPVYDRYRLRPGDTIDGPAIVEERESTFVLGPESLVRVDDLLNLVVEFLSS
ncbi:MAG TPA: hydantoinase/oxoprolinase family protein, partial [Nitrolancea sp.]